MKILSIQSWVAYGHVGNAAASFPLQRLGAEVWAVHTVQFSNHTGYGAWTGRVFEASDIAALIDGIAARGVLGDCDALLSGYMGSAAIGVAVLDAQARLRGANPASLWCCDPVIGDDDTGEYVRDGIADLLRDRAVPEADLLTPNLFELRRLTGAACADTAGTLAAARALLARMRAAGPRAMLVTSATLNETPRDALDVIALAADGGAWRLRTRRLPLAVNGAGDVIAALFLAGVLRGDAVPAAASYAVSAVHGLLRVTARLGRRELALVAAQDEFFAPSERVVPEAL